MILNILRNMNLRFDFVFNNKGCRLGDIVDNIVDDVGGCHR